MLKELRSVLTVRAAETEERETAALLRQNPDATVSKPDSTSTTSAAEQESQSPNKPKSKYSYVPYEGNQRLLANVGLPPGSQGNFGNHGDGDSGHQGDESLPDKPDLKELKKKLAGIGGENFSFSANVAAMAAARSQQVAPRGEDMFMDEGEKSSSGSGSDTEQYTVI